MRLLMAGLAVVLLSGCMKPMIEQTIQGDDLLTVHSDVNFLSPSFTLPVRSKCIKQDGVTTVININDETHTCYGTYVEVQHLPAGYQNGAGSGIGDSVTTVGSAALIMHGLRGMGDKDSNNTTNNNDTESNGGNSLSSARSDSYSQSGASAAASGGAGGNGYGGKGGNSSSMSSSGMPMGGRD